MFDLIKIELPDNGDIPLQVTELWRELFGEEEVCNTRGQFRGDETSFYHDTLYVALQNGKLAACCHITRQKNGFIAGLGGVASDKLFRGQGVADKVIEFAMDDLDKCGCDAVFLGTSNPIAANLYMKYGFNYIPGTSAMLRVSGGKRFNDVLKREISVSGKVEIKRGDASLRLALIPLVYNGCDMLICDAAAGIFGIKTFVQTSCMGLYPRYENIRQKGGDFFMLVSGSHCLGAASFLPTPGMPGKGIGDIFCTPESMEYAPELLTAVRAAAEAENSDLIFPVSPADGLKCDLLKSCGAKSVGNGQINHSTGVTLNVVHFAWK